MIQQDSQPVQQDSQRIEQNSQPVQQDSQPVQQNNQCKAIGHSLVAWFKKAKRDLPWRRDYAPYGVWISEMMLQQTQMERGVAYYGRWMERFPDIRSVAEAPEDVLLKAWEGLGYYRRVRHVQAAAKTIMAEYGGIFPSDYKDIRKLSGIGDYTAGAIASIAFEQEVPAVDANVERVFARLFDIDKPVKNKDTAAQIRELVMMAMPAHEARHFNQAIMELGALVCRKGPDCGHCPVAEYCEAYRLGIVHERPVLAAKKASVAMDVATGVLVHQGKIYVQKRMDTGLWAGFWEFPGGRIERGESPEQAVVREFMEETGFAVRIRSKLAVVKHGYTSYRVTLHCFALELVGGVGPVEGPDEGPVEGPDGGPIEGLDGTEPRTDLMPVPTLTAATAYDWLDMDALDALTLPAGHRKLLDKLHMDMLQRDMLFTLS